MQEFQELNVRHNKLRKHLALIADCKDEINDAIEKQRWFRFNNTGTVIFDRDTNLLWADPMKFSYGKNGNRAPYSAADNYAEVREMLEGKNYHWVGNCLDWTIPTVDELWQLVEDKTFPPLKGDNWRIRWKRNWLTRSGCLDLDRGIDAVSNDDAYVIPCSHSLVPRAPKTTLEIFIDNLLDPIFNDYRIMELYRQLYHPPKYHLVKNPAAPPIEGFETSDLLDYISHLETQLFEFEAQAEEICARLEHWRQHLNA